MMLRYCTPLLVLLAAPLAAQQTKPLDPANFDTTCAPCRDFFAYANGGWLKRTTIPADQPGWGAFNELQEANFAALRQVLDEASAAARTTADPDLRKLGTYYASCMDSVRSEAAGMRPLKPELQRIAGLRDRHQLPGVIAHLHGMGVPAAFVFRSTQDARNSSRVIAEAYQGGLGLPERDYYTRTDSASIALRERYRAHVTRLFVLAGHGSADAAAAGRHVLEIETALAQAAMAPVELRDPEAVYHLTAVRALEAENPRFGWDRYLQAVGLPGVHDLNVGQPRFVQALDSLAARTPLAAWRRYLEWRLLATNAPALSAAFVNESFAFNSATLRGIKEMRPRWKRCLIRTDAALGEVLGKAYVAKHFTPTAKARALEMVGNIRAELRERLGKVDWMTEPTKAKAYAKLEAIVNKIGYPDRWRDYSALRVEPAAFATNATRAAAFQVRRDLAKIGKPVDRNEWLMSPPTVNAYYNPPVNEIAFPAGIMQPPFFDPRADDAVNYGGMGAVIGHEITHGFDDQGRQYDAQGNLSGWWSTEDEQAFNARADVVRRQFDGYVAVDTIKVNGKLTLGENIADLAGLTIAYGAYRRSLGGREPEPIDGFSGPQRFFLAWAQVWRGMYRPEYAALLAQVDPHAPPHLRTNGPLSNMPEFAAAFSCKAGDPMVRETRAEIW
jgi:putative endopeptidase